MNAKKISKSDIICLLGIVLMCLCLDWDKNAIKCFISGGFSAWLTSRIFPCIKHA